MQWHIFHSGFVNGPPQETQAGFVSNPSGEAQAFTQSKVAVSCTMIVMFLKAGHWDRRSMANFFGEENLCIKT